MIGASMEVIEHHIKSHPCKTTVTHALCPHGTTLVVLCDGCRSSMIASARPGDPCWHLAVVVTGEPPSDQAQWMPVDPAAIPLVWGLL